MKSQIPESIKEIITNLRSQDNRITANPQFIVQKKEITYGFDSGWSDDFIWVDRGDEVYDEYIIEDLNKKDENYEEIDPRYYKCYFRTDWVFVQPFLTEVAAQRYIKRNGHNLGGPENCRIYVESGYRNAEWQTIRDFFLTLDAKEGD